MFGALRNELTRERFDVVEMPECGGEGAFLNHCLDLPTVVRLHSPAQLIMETYDTKASDRLLTAIVERIGMTGARVMSSCSHWLADQVRTRIGLDRPITVIPNGIDLALFDQDAGIDIHDRFGIPRDRTTVFFANRLEERKGIHIVRDVLGTVLEQHPDVTFVLAGADPDGMVERELMPIARAVGQERGLCHLGRISLAEVRACLKQIDVFMLPSIWENAPYSLLEAMSAGRAIVASDCGGVPEMIRHDIDGVVARTGDAASFRRALDRLLKSESLRRRLGQSARQRIEARFTDEHVARRSLEFYEWALGAPAAPHAAGRSRPVFEVGPDNWFQVWWLRSDSLVEPPAIRHGEDGAAVLQALSLDQLAFVLTILGRAYREEVGRSDTEERRFLEDLEAIYRNKALVARHAGAGSPTDTRLGLPSLSHPLFADEISANRFVDELWRLGDDPSVSEWLGREIEAPDFPERASQRTSLRRLAVEALNRRPNGSALAAMRAIYRSVPHRSVVIRQDTDYLSEAPDSALERAIDELGLHAPLQRPPVFGKSSTSRAGGTTPSEEVTVLIPSYRHEAWIRTAIDSALRQTHAQLRVLVVDDASPDATAAEAMELDDARIEVRVNARNLGLGESLAAALHSIDTPIVALLNSDDAFHPERLERCLGVLREDPRAALVTTGVILMDGKERRLTATNSCALDIGPRAHQWVRWYHGVCSGLTAPEDWTSFARLLRHNHLATSSNIVCRTDVLRDHIRELRPLKYCVDWTLFLHAASTGGLRHVPEPLLGYRLHDANTVWFGDDSRPGYVLEVNHVVARATAAWVRHQAGLGRSADAIVEALAGILRHDVSRHGESDGLALFLASATATLEAAREPGQLGADTTRLAEEVLARKLMVRALDDVDLEPWRIAELVRDRDRNRIDRHVADAFVRRARALESAAGRIRLDHTTADERARDLDDVRERLEVERAANDAIRAESAWRESERLRLGHQLATVERRLANAHESLRRESAKVDDQIEWLRVNALSHLRELRHLRESSEWRIGNLLLNKLCLKIAYKPLSRLAKHVRIGAARTTARVSRRLASASGQVVLVCDGAFPSQTESWLVAEWRTLHDAGIDASIACWGKGSSASLLATERPALAARHVLYYDRRLQAADRRWFERRARQAVDEVLQETSGDVAGRLFTLARSAEALGAAFIHGGGSGFRTVAAWAVGKLLHVPFGLHFAGPELRGPWSAFLSRAVLDAAVVTADTESTAARLRELVGAAIPALFVRPPFVHGDAPAQHADLLDPRRVGCIGPFTDGHSTMLLADAVKLAVDRGVDLHVDIIGHEVLDGRSLEAVNWLRGRIAELGIEDRFVFGGGSEPANVFRLLGRIGSLVELSGGSGREHQGLPSGVAAAMAAGRPVIGFRGALDGTVRDAQEGILAPPRDPAALADALCRLANDHAYRASLGRAARARYDAVLAPDVAGARFCRTVRALIDGSRASPDRR
jgi:glycosyltransferase involved in cell wall biosynthesis